MIYRVLQLTPPVLVTQKIKQFFEKEWLMPKKPKFYDVLMCFVGVFDQLSIETVDSLISTLCEELLSNFFNLVKFAFYIKVFCEKIMVLQ